MNWTDERVELLKKLWSEGLSASQIAAQLGGVSRNAVIGKVHRLKLSGRGKTTTAAPRSKKVNTPAAAPRPAVQNNNSGTHTTTMRTATVTKTVGATALPDGICDRGCGGNRHQARLRRRGANFPPSDPVAA